MDTHTYTCYIKSHCNFPDYEVILQANNEDEALTQFSKMTHWSKEDLKEFVTQLCSVCRDPIPSVCWGEYTHYTD